MLQRRTLLIASIVLAAWTFASPATLQAQPNLKPFAAHILPDNQRVVVAGEDGALALFTLPDLTVVRRFTGDLGKKIKSVAVSTDGKWLAAFYDKGKLFVFDVETGEAKHQIANPDLKPGPLMYSPLGRLLVLSNTNRLMQFDAVTAAPIGKAIEIRGGMPTLSADGKYLAVVGAFTNVFVYDIVENKDIMGGISWTSAPELKSFQTGYDANPVFVGFRNDGRVSLGLAFIKKATVGGPPGVPSDASTSLEGRMVTFKPEKPLPLEVTTKSLFPVMNSTVYADGKIMAVSYGSVALWSIDDATAATPWETVDPGKTRVLDGADISADRVWVVGVSKRSGEIEVWDTRTLEKKEKKMFGRVVLSWQQPTLVKMMKMP